MPNKYRARAWRRKTQIKRPPSSQAAAELTHLEILQEANVIEGERMGRAERGQLRRAKRKT